MNDLSVISGVGVLIAVISFLAYKLGRSKEGLANAEKEVATVEEAKLIRERLNNDDSLRKKVKRRFSR